MPDGMAANRELLRRALGNDRLCHREASVSGGRRQQDSSGQVDVARMVVVFLLTEKPEAYNLPPAPTRPVARMLRRYAWSAAVGVGLTAISAVALARSGR